MGRGGGHGGGHHGGGGGGHSHYHHHSYYGGYRSSYYSSGSTGECGIPGYIAQIILCSLIFLALGGFVVYALLTCEPIYCDTASTDVFDGEQNLCKVPSGKDTVHVEVDHSMQSYFTSYLFQSEPDVLDQVRNVHYSDKSVRVHSDDYIYYAFALPKGSVINFSLSSDSSSAEWYLSVDYSEISDIRYNYIWKGSGYNPRPYSFKVTQSRTYYLTSYNDGYFSMLTDWDVYVDYTQYNLSGPISTCKNQQKCSFNKASGKYIVSTLQSGSLSQNEFTMDQIYFGKNYSAILKTILIVSVIAVFFLISVIVSLVKVCALVNSSFVSRASPASTTVVVQASPVTPTTPINSYSSTPASSYGTPTTPVSSYGAPSAPDYVTPSAPAMPYPNNDPYYAQSGSSGYAVIS